MSNKIFLCSDLDRTILPNGPQKESPEARQLLHLLARRPEITLAYVSGRNLQLLQAAVEEYQIPIPDIAVGDVGTTIYGIMDGEWLPLNAWEEEIAPDWNGRNHAQLSSMLSDIDEVTLQEPENQNTFKLSYFAPPDLDYRRLLDTIQDRLRDDGVQASLIWSVDEEKNQGLLDVLPENATKYHAIRFLMRHNHFDLSATVFAGDSGNDLPVLTSHLQTVLVGNAAEDIRCRAQQEVKAKGIGDTLYCAEGGFMGMNGNYAAGVIEGLVHFIPRTADWLK